MDRWAEFHWEAERPRSSRVVAFSSTELRQSPEVSMSSMVDDRPFEIVRAWEDHARCHSKSHQRERGCVHVQPKNVAPL